MLTCAGAAVPIEAPQPSPEERIAKIALAAGAQYGLALAGGYALQAHGVGSPSGEVGLFSPRAITDMSAGSPRGAVYLPASARPASTALHS